MEKKYYFKGTNTEVKFDSDLFLTLVSSDTRGIIRSNKEIVKVEEEQIKSLMSLDLIEEREEYPIPIDVEYYIRAFGEGLGRYDSDAEDLFLDLYRMYPMEALCILWREIMSEFDLFYKDKLDNYAKVYFISKKDGLVEEFNVRGPVGNYKFILFRTKEDAELAIEITKSYYNEVFGK